MCDGQRRFLFVIFSASDRDALLSVGVYVCRWCAGSNGEIELAFWVMIRQVDCVTRDAGVCLYKRQG